MNILGGLSLITANYDEIYHCILTDSKYSIESKRTLTYRVTALLKKAGRDISISKIPKEDRRKIPHLTEEELAIYIAKLPLHILINFTHRSISIQLIYAHFS